MMKVDKRVNHSGPYRSSARTVLEELLSHPISRFSGEIEGLQERLDDLREEYRDDEPPLLLAFLMETMEHEIELTKHDCVLMREMMAAFGYSKRKIDVWEYGSMREWPLLWNKIPMMNHVGTLHFYEKRGEENVSIITDRDWETGEWDLTAYFMHTALCDRVYDKISDGTYTFYSKETVRNDNRVYCCYLHKPIQEKRKIMEIIMSPEEHGREHLHVAEPEPLPEPEESEEERSEREERKMENRTLLAYYYRLL
jgi:hypothetical protein